MVVCIIDIETTPLPAADRIWCIVTKEIDKPPRVWLEDNFEEFKDYARTVDYWVGHNALGFDVPRIRDILDLPIDTSKVVDTFVVSRLVNYNGYSTHSLDELGQSLGFPKTKFTDFTKFSQEMVDYCVNDVLVTEKIYKRYEKMIWDTKWADAIRIEHDMVLICNDMSANGFKFNSDRAREMLDTIKARMSDLEVQFQQAWPPQLTEVNRLKYRVNKDGTLHSAVQKSVTRYPKTRLQGDEVVCLDYKSFNPGSSKDRIEKLWEAGWQPYVKSKTHLEFSRANVGDKWGKSRLSPQLYKEKQDYFNYYGWTVGEENLSTLPESAPEAAQRLAEWLTLEGRRSSLEEWLGCVSEDGRIHGKFWNIGAWTHRMSHSNPNQANIASVFHGTPRNAVEQVKAEFDGDMRAIWCVDEGSTLVGTDADGIQLRILAHYLKNDDYVHAIVSGRKEDETDIHNLNRRALALNHIQRDDAKTFIYAWLLGAGTAKVASILRTNQSAARSATKSFLANTAGLTELKRGQIVRDAKRGFFVGLDGRRVVCNSEHLMLAGYLQNAEAIIMKRACRLWREWADTERILYKHINFVHDEWQTECLGSRDMAVRLGQLQRLAIEQTGRDLNLYCPLAGSSSFGFNWKDTH